MTEGSPRLTAAQVILLAADDLDRAGHQEFTEWELTVAAWQRDGNRFGMRGFEDQHPDHKRVMTEIMGQTKRDNPIRRMFMEKTRSNHYRLTDLGRSEAASLRSLDKHAEKDARSPAKVYDAIKPFVNHKVFQSWLADPEEPRSWLSASVFLQLGSHDPNELNDRIRAVLTAARRAQEWCKANSRESLTYGPSGGPGRPIPFTEVERIPEFVGVLEQRFERQMSAIRKRGS